MVYKHCQKESIFSFELHPKGRSSGTYCYDHHDIILGLVFLDGAEGDVPRYVSGKDLQLLALFYYLLREN